MSDSATRVPRYAWVILLLVFLSSMAAPLHMFKVPPVMELLMTRFGLSLAAAGWLMSVFAVIGVVLALPSGFIVGRVGIKKAGLIALLFLIVGSSLGALSTNIVILLGSRVLEGVGMCLMSIAAPAAIAAWFPPSKRGLAMGIWGTWVPIGTIVIFTVAPWWSEMFSWSGVWWLCSGYTIVMLVCFLLFFRMPAPTAGQELAAQPQKATSFAAEWTKVRNVLKDPNPWLLSASFAAYMMVAIPLMTFMPIFFQTERQFSPERASFIVTIMLIANMIAVSLGGVISDAIGSRKKCIITPYLIVAAFMGFFFLPGDGVIYTLILVGFIGGLAITASFSGATEVVSKPEDAGTSLAILALGQNTGMFVGPALFGAVAQGAGWAMAGYVTIPILLAGIYAAYKVRLR